MDGTESYMINPNRKKASHGSSGSNSYEASYLIPSCDFLYT